VVNFINNRENDNAAYVDKKYSELLEDKAYIIGEVVDSHEGVELC
ncbi:phosphoribosylformylglycinamidine cyclo-ligase, partial [Clostridioides difficile]